MPETPIENTPTPQPKSSNRRMIWMVIILTVLVLLFLLSAVAVDNIRQSIYNQPSPTPIATNPTPTPDETASWKTYKSIKNQFTFRYPSEIILYEADDASVHLKFKEELPANAPDGFELSPGYEMNFKIGKLDSKTLKSIAQEGMVKFNEYGSITKPLSETTIGDYLGFTYSAVIQVGSTYIYLPSQTKSYVEINYSLNDMNNKGHQNEVNQILSTFKFTDASPSATPKAATPSGDQVACTQDAKQCPDGSYVGRTGPNCEFTKCPGE